MDNFEITLVEYGLKFKKDIATKTNLSISDPILFKNYIIQNLFGNYRKLFCTDAQNLRRLKQDKINFILSLQMHDYKATSNNILAKEQKFILFKTTMSRSTFNEFEHKIKHEPLEQIINQE